MKSINVISLLFVVISAISNSFSQPLKELGKSEKAGKSIFIVVTDKSAIGTDALVKLAENAQKKNPKVDLIKLDRDDLANKEFISKYRLSGATLPLVLVVASNGVVSGGLSATDATTEKLISYIPSKTQAEVLLGFENGKAAFIVCGKKNAKDKDALEEECKKAIATLGNKAIQVFVDVENKDEANFLALIKPELSNTNVLVFNGKGQFTGTLESNAKSDEMLKSVNKKMGGCCPGGSTSGCGKK